jgi:hypothetical protein
MAAAMATNAEAKKMKIFNPSPYAVTAVQAKKPGAKEWDADVLGKIALGVGKVAEVELPAIAPDCKVDLRITFDDGHKVEKSNVDVCATDVLQSSDQ